MLQIGIGAQLARPVPLESQLHLVAWNTTAVVSHPD
jgi:hypothetical protein